MRLQFIGYEKREHVAYVTINRPEVLNALHPPAVAELNEAWTDVIADDDIWVAVLTGAGDRAFCVGADLKYRVATGAEEAVAAYPANVLDQCLKPVIAAINGYALGGGLELALRCDVLVAAADAQLGLPEARRGLLADSGGTVKVPRRIPYHVAMGMILTGRPISAQEAMRVGLVNEVAERADLDATVGRWRDAMLECGPLALQAAKQVARDTISLPVPDALRATEELAAVRRLRASDDYAEGPRAFVDKRAPRWTGR